MLTKSATTGRSATAVRFECKAADDAAHTITGLAAAWSLDQGGDVIHKGAFARTLDHWRASKKTRPIPLIDSHDAYTSVVNVIGRMTEASETDDGLEATFEFVPDDTRSDAAYRRAKGGFVSGLSIGYEAVRWEYTQKEGGDSWDRIRHLKEVRLLEVSLVVMPMNDDARVASVKQFAALETAIKAGTLSPDQLQQLRALLDAPPAGTPEGDSPAPDAKGLAPDDPKRLALDETLRAITLRSLAA